MKNGSTLGNGEAESRSGWSAESGRAVGAVPFDVRQAMFVFFRRRRLGALVVLLTLVGVLAGNYLVYPVYESTAKVLVERAAGLDIPFSREQIAFKKAEITRTQGELLCSGPVLEAVVHRLNLDQRPLPTGSLRDSVHEFGRAVWARCLAVKEGAKRLILERVFGRTYAPPSRPDPFRTVVDQLRRSVAVEPVPSTDILALKVTDRDAEMAAAIANAITEAYLAMTLEAQRRRARNVYQALDEQVIAFQPTFDEAESRVQHFEDEYQARLLDEQIRTKMQEISALEVTYWELVETKQSKLVSLRLALARLEQVYDVGHPKVVAARSELEEALRRYDLDRKEPTGDESPSSNEYVDALKARIADAHKEIERLTSLEATYSRLVHKKEQQEELLVFLQKKRGEAQIAEATRMMGTYIVEPATPMLKPKLPRKTLNLVLGLLGGLLMAGLVCGLLEFCDRSVKTPMDVQRATGLEVLGAIPDWRHVGRRDAETI